MPFNTRRPRTGGPSSSYSSSRTSAGGPRRSFGGGRPMGGGGGGFRSGGGKRRGPAKDYIHPSRFVKVAKPVEQEEYHATNTRSEERRVR